MCVAFTHTQPTNQSTTTLKQQEDAAELLRLLRDKLQLAWTGHDVRDVTVFCVWEEGVGVGVCGLVIFYTHTHRTPTNKQPGARVQGAAGEGKAVPLLSLRGHAPGAFFACSLVSLASCLFIHPSIDPTRHTLRVHTYTHTHPSEHRQVPHLRGPIPCCGPHGGPGAGDCAQRAALGLAQGGAGVLHADRDARREVSRCGGCGFLVLVRWVVQCKNTRPIIPHTYIQPQQPLPLREEMPQHPPARHAVRALLLS